ncbi:MAG: ABC transporter transmembrane domain-containing protein, partial [Candidatus Methylacidiphilales bacterium]|nr:ABC transporter transmembrane domain-containing protein [Candidatus Methylacidiphilales bacterium]
MALTSTNPDAGPNKSDGPDDSPSSAAAAPAFSTMETAGLLWNMARPIFARWWPVILLHVVLSILTLSVLQGAATVLLGQLTNAIAGRQAVAADGLDASSLAASAELNETLIPLFILWVVVLAISVIAGFAQKYVMAVVDSRIGMDMQRATFSALLRQDLSYFHSQGKSPGELVMTLNHLTVQVQMAARTLLIDGVVQVTSFVIIGTLLLHSLSDLAVTGGGNPDARVWWIFGGVVVLGGACSWWINSRGPNLHSASQDLQAAMMRMNTLLTSVMTSPDEVKVLQAEELFEKEHLAAALHMQHQKLALARKLEATNTLRTIPADLVQAALIGLAVLLVLLYPGGGAFKPGILITIVGLTPQLMMVMEMIAGWRAEIAMSGPAIRAVSEILQTPKDGVRTRAAEQSVS